MTIGGSGNSIGQGSSVQSRGLHQIRPVTCGSGADARSQLVHEAGAQSAQGWMVELGDTPDWSFSPTSAQTAHDPNWGDSTPKGNAGAGPQIGEHSGRRFRRLVLDSGRDQSGVCSSGSCGVVVGDGNSDARRVHSERLPAAVCHSSQLSGEVHTISNDSNHAQLYDHNHNNMERTKLPYIAGTLPGNRGGKALGLSKSCTRVDLADPRYASTCPSTDPDDGGLLLY